MKNTPITCAGKVIFDGLYYTIVFLFRFVKLSVDISLTSLLRTIWRKIIENPPCLDYFIVADRRYDLNYFGQLFELIHLLIIDLYVLQNKLGRPVCGIVARNAEDANRCFICLAAVDSSP